MGWAVGTQGGRWIGYGVPAVCDYPGCGKRIDRGLAYRCGEGRVDGCELYFCTDHLEHYVSTEGDSGADGGWVCTRCYHGNPPFKPTPDTREWIEHMLGDESWAHWRDEHPGSVTRLKGELQAIKAESDGAA